MYILYWFTQSSIPSKVFILINIYPFNKINLGFYVKYQQLSPFLSQLILHILDFYLFRASNGSKIRTFIGVESIFTLVLMDCHWVMNTWFFQIITYMRDSMCQSIRAPLQFRAVAFGPGTSREIVNLIYVMYLVPVSHWRPI